MRGMHLIGSVLFALLGALTCLAQDQAPAKKPSGLLGDLVTVDAAKGVLTIRLADGSTATATLTGATEYVRVQPGSTSLDGAEKIGLDTLATGDRVWARGSDKDATGALVARQVVLMSAKAISEKLQRERREWQTRGAFGTVTAVDPARSEISLKTNRGTDLVVSVGPSTSLLRLKPGARDLSGAEHIGVGDITTGSQIAVRGDEPIAEGRLAAAEIVTGAFPRPARGRIASIDVARRELKVTTPDGTSTTIVLAADAIVRKLNPPQGGREGGAPGAPDRAGAAERPGRGEAPNGGPRAQRGGLGMLFGDRNELLGRTEPFRLEDLAVGDFVFAVADPDAQGATDKATLLVKVQVPAGTPQRGPAAPMDFPATPGADFPN